MHWKSAKSQQDKFLFTIIIMKSLFFRDKAFTKTSIVKIENSFSWKTPLMKASHTSLSFGTGVKMCLLIRTREYPPLDSKISEFWWPVVFLFFSLPSPGTCAASSPTWIRHQTTMTKKWFLTSCGTWACWKSSGSEKWGSQSTSPSSTSSRDTNAS